MKFGTSHLLVIGAVLILFGLAVVVREEAFVEKQPDIKAGQHAEFEATAEQKEQLLHAAEAAGNSKSPAADGISLRQNTSVIYTSLNAIALCCNTIQSRISVGHSVSN